MKINLLSYVEKVKLIDILLAPVDFRYFCIARYINLPDMDVIAAIGKLILY